MYNMDNSIISFTDEFRVLLLYEKACSCIERQKSLRSCLFQIGRFVGKRVCIINFFFLKV